ncbi:MAG TPA: aminopeptidase [Gammaproteobacteria bacterium]|nr:aminopeptidase [Gammaproteobacteria bacterium]
MPGSVRMGLLAAALATMSGCSLTYYWQAAAGHLDLVRRRTPIETVLEDPAQSPAVKESLRRVVEMRRFAVDVLGLPDNDSYMSYADLQRPYVVWNVVAAAEFDVVPQQWCFVFLGCVSYRGYFSRDAAETYAATLREEGFDTYVAGASAYSTLGYFADPVLNTMLAGGEAYVAGILFHELAHQKSYLRGDSDLNEAFATAVQQYGTLAWLEEHGAPEEVEAFRRGLRRQDGFTALVAEQRERLSALYASGMAVDDLRPAKAAAFARMREDYARLKQSWGGIGEYDGWFEQPLNNAQLASVATYRRWLPGLSWYLERNGLEALYAQMERLEALGARERERELEAWLDAADPAGRFEVG